MEFSRNESGLILAHQSMDSAALERALKAHDPKLSLQAWPQISGPPLWKVVATVGSARPPVTVAVWADDDGTPRPLSSGLLDLVQRLDRNSRGDYLSDDELNAKRRDELRRKVEADNEALRSDHERFWSPVYGGVLHRGQYLRRARDKQRARGENV